MQILNTKQNSIEKIIDKISQSRSKKVDVEDIVKRIITKVKSEGDNALLEFGRNFDSEKLNSIIVSKEEINESYSLVKKDFISSLKFAAKNITKFHKSVLTKNEPVVETIKGVKVWREFRPIEKVGLYIPGGKAVYPSTVLMLGIPAKIAGCNEIILCSPADRSGKINPQILVAADLVGINKIFKAGGAQAIAALAMGTESIPKVNKIFGPGNQYVTTAKMLLFGEVDIDMPAGPTELMIIADETATPSWVAADLLSQLEHGEDSQVILVAYDEKFIQQVLYEVEKQTRNLERKNIVQKSEKISFAIIAKNDSEMIQLANEYAPEHLEIISKNENKILKKINNAGSVFLGKYSSEPLGDYVTGSNHTLPTSGFAKIFEALSTYSFGKMMQIQKVTNKGYRQLKNSAEILAENEGLTAHKNAVTIRSNQL